MSDTNDMRSKFEAWLKAESLPLVPEYKERLKTGEYRSPWSQSNWMAYQAGRAAGAASAQVEQDDDTTTKGQYRNMFLGACGALGLINEKLGLDPDDGGANPILDAIEKLQGEQEPVAWIRFTSDGCYEGPVMDSAMEDARKKSGAWTPLYAAPVPQGEQCPSDEDIYKHYKALNLPHVPVMWTAALGTVRAVLSALQAVPQGEPVAVAGDLSKRLRALATDPKQSKVVCLGKAEALKIADEIDRYYGGMLTWKQAAEKKDADWNAERMARVNERCEARAKAAATMPQGEQCPDVVAALLAALETARNGLIWYHTEYPCVTNSCDDEALAKIDAAMKAVQPKDAK